jgi:circadian clock protein KaiC
MEHKGNFRDAVVSSGIPELDALVGGGLDKGTTTLVQGPAGTGKSSLALRYCWAAAERGETAAVYCFDERPETLFARAAALGMPLRPHIDSGAIRLRQIDPAEMGPGEFAYDVKNHVEQEDTTIVVIDSLNGFFYAMPEQQALVLHLHELFSYLGQRGTTSICTLAQQGLLGATASPIDVSYLADSILLLRFFELRGEIRKALSVVKRRGGAHEQTIREFTFKRGSISLGKPLVGFQGVLTGVPHPLPDDSSPE